MLFIDVISNRRVTRTHWVWICFVWSPFTLFKRSATLCNGQTFGQNGLKAFYLNNDILWNVSFIFVAN
eukprot:UN11773